MTETWNQCALASSIYAARHHQRQPEQVADDAVETHISEGPNVIIFVLDSSTIVSTRLD
jgi:hypothetical protein